MRMKNKLRFMFHVINLHILQVISTIDTTSLVVIDSSELKALQT